MHVALNVFQKEKYVPVSVYLWGNTVNSLMFARDLFGDFRDHIKFANINTLYPQT